MIEMKNGELHFAEYYFLSKDNKQHFLGVPATWWEDFCEKYKIFSKEKNITSNLLNLRDFFENYLETQNIKIIDSYVSFQPTNSVPPETIQDLLAEKKPTLTQRLRNAFSRKKRGSA